MKIFFVLWTILGILAVVQLYKNGLWDEDSSIAKKLIVIILCGPITWALFAYGLFIAILEEIISLFDR